MYILPLFRKEIKRPPKSNLNSFLILPITAESIYKSLKKYPEENNVLKDKMTTYIFFNKELSKHEQYQYKKKKFGQLIRKYP